MNKWKIPSGSVFQQVKDGQVVVADTIAMAELQQIAAEALDLLEELVGEYQSYYSIQGAHITNRVRAFLAKHRAEEKTERSPVSQAVEDLDKAVYDFTKTMKQALDCLRAKMGDVSAVNRMGEK